MKEGRKEHGESLFSTLPSEESGRLLMLVSRLASTSSISSLIKHARSSSFRGN